jgi:hypothetical protein
VTKRISRSLAYSFVNLVTGFFANFCSLLLRIIATGELLARLLGIDYLDSHVSWIPMLI